MFNKAHYTARKLGAIALVGFLLAGTPTAAQAGDHRYNRHDREECRPIIKKIKVGNITYTERGTACRNGYGGWSMVTPSRYPVERVYFHDGHRTVPLDDHARWNRGYGHKVHKHNKHGWDDDDRRHHGSDRHDKRCKH